MLPNFGADSSDFSFENKLLRIKRIKIKFSIIQNCISGRPLMTSRIFRVFDPLDPDDDSVVTKYFNLIRNPLEPHPPNTLLLLILPNYKKRLL